MATWSLLWLSGFTLNVRSRKADLWFYSSSCNTELQLLFQNLPHSIFPVPLALLVQIPPSLSPRSQTCPDIFKVLHHCCSSLALQWCLHSHHSHLLPALLPSHTHCSCRRLLAQHFSGISTRLLPSALPIQLFHLEFSSLCALPCFNALLRTLTCSCGFPIPSDSVIFSHSASCLSYDASSTCAGSFLDGIK